MPLRRALAGTLQATAFAAGAWTIVSVSGGLLPLAASGLCHPQTQPGVPLVVGRNDARSGVVRSAALLPDDQITLGVAYVLATPAALDFSL